MDEPMDNGWADGRWTVGWMDEWVGKLMDGWMNECTDRWMAGQ